MPKAADKRVRQRDLYLAFLYIGAIATARRGSALAKEASRFVPGTLKDCAAKVDQAVDKAAAIALFLPFAIVDMRSGK